LASYTRARRRHLNITHAESHPSDASGAGAGRALVAVLLFSLNPVLFRQLPLDAVTILAGVSAIAAVALLSAAAVRGRAARIVAPSAAWLPTIRLAVWFTVNNALYLTAIQNTTIANATMTHYLAPLIVAALAAPLLGEHVRPRAAVAMGLAGTGVVVMLAGSGLSFDDTQFIGLLAGSASALFFALEIVEKKVLAPSDAADVVAARYLILAVVLLAAFVDYRALASLRGLEAGLLVFAGVVAAAVGNILFNSALRTISAQRAATIGYLEPVGAIAWALLLIREVPDRFGIAGGALVIAGILLVIRMREPGGRTPLARPPSLSTG
jgi:drug/metabolite transporter (DMT)-like permease